MKFLKVYAVLSEVMLVLALPISVLMQWVLVEEARYVGRENPEVADLVLPYSIAAVAAVLCAQVLLVVLFVFVLKVARGTFFKSATRKWISLAQAMVLIGPGIVCAVGFHAAFTPASSPVMALAFLGGGLLAVGLFSLVGLAKSLFDAALADRGELEGVI